MLLRFIIIGTIISLIISIAFLLFLGKKPLNINLSDGIPDKVKAAIGEHAPGIDVTFICFS